ncbi:hypothetical protein J5N97_001510 [Dioscorea zingiberensis]|uniref:Uncharacterized protein n=1 Tax=Dioscorea zingiberensis TaxID=325984 RepID=A0A9D5H2E0_9LILI|nr:hypothetical protein J5N97_001510 [Dioscorea zingiberensis]
MEYCPSDKKATCPVCKQSCSQKNLTRLYFQSSGDATRLYSEVDAEAFAEKVNGFEAMLGGMEALIGSITSTLQSRQLRIKELNQKLSRWKEFWKAEEARNEEVRNENKSLERLVLQKDQELLRKSSECLKLEERSLMLAKEVAALKLVTDLNLGEEEMVKLASIGHGANHANTVDVLKSSLAHRNKSYKELMAQCNSLGTAEARAQQKLDKANEKIKSLKARLQELERAVEEKVNGTLRTFKAPNVLKPERVNIDCVVKNSSSVDNHSANKHLQGHQSVACLRDPILPGHFVHEVASRNVSKWCRIAEQKASPSVTTQAQINKRILIPVGADGSEGRIKVLRAHDQYSVG